MNNKVRIPHIEDLIFEGPNGIGSMLQILNEFTNEQTALHITTKWDGAPAIICGQHPKTNQFFVATKSFWNIDSKVNYTAEDIERNHFNSPGLVCKLKSCLTYLPELNIKGVLQGDLMYEHCDLYRSGNNGEWLCFKPNVVEYKFPIKSDTAKRIAESAIGIVFHTSYGPLMEANYKVDIGKLNLLSKNVWFRDASLSTPPYFTTEEKNIIWQSMIQIQNALLRCSPKVINAFVANESIKTLTKQYINDTVRKGKNNYFGAPSMHHFIINKMSDSISEAVKPETIANRKAKLNAMDEWFINATPSLEKMFEAYNAIVAIKELIISKLDGVTTNQLTSEGFVVSLPGNVVKLIDRPKFSHENFVNGRDWK